MTELKVLIVGPKSSGKSALTNFIADAVQNSENPNIAPTQPTKGVRIVEFDRKIRTQKGEVREASLLRVGGVCMRGSPLLPPHSLFFVMHIVTAATFSAAKHFSGTVGCFGRPTI